MRDELDAAIELVERFVRIPLVVRRAERVESCKPTDMFLESICRAYMGEREGERECANVREDE